MSLADVDTGHLHISFYDYFTGLPIVDPVSGMTSLDMPYADCQVVDQMYQPKKNLISTAHVEFRNLIESPQLRPLLQSIFRDQFGLDKTPRIEIFAHQPDCGDPLFSGYVVPGGVTEKAGVVTIDCEDDMTRGKWSLLDSIEEFDDPLPSYYTRALSAWVDLVNEDFSSVAGLTGGSYNNLSYVVRQGYNGSTPTGFTDTLQTPKVYTPTVGDTILMEAIASLPWDPRSAATNFGSALTLYFRDGFEYAGIAAASNTSSLPEPANPGVYINSNENIGGGIGSAVVQRINSSVTLLQDVGLVPNPLFGRLQFIIKFVSTSAIVLRLFFNRQELFAPYTVAITDFPTFSNASGGGWNFGIAMGNSTIASVATIYRWRVRLLSGRSLYVRQAARFKPNTQSAIYYLSNNEDSFKFLQWVCENDGTEYRPIYKHGIGKTEVELDVQGSLGVDTSQVVGFGQPGIAGVAGDLSTTVPETVGASVGSFLDTSGVIPPPFRFEEGYNLTDNPQLNTKSEPFANAVDRVGANAADAQVAGSIWSVLDTGNPIQGIAPRRPYIEIVSNDDRTTLDSYAQTLANFDLTRKMDPIPSITIKVLEQLEFAYKWRAGDKVYLRTKSLLTNLEQAMRVMQIKYSAGQAEREIVLGYMPWDPQSLKFLADNASQAWLFDQSGKSGLTFEYPIQGNGLALTSGVQSFLMPFSLDQFNTGTIILNASIRWTTDGSGGTDVLSVVPIFDNYNASPFVPNASAKASSTDSGLQDCTARLNQLGQHSLSFIDNGANTKLLSAVITMRMKL